MNKNYLLVLLIFSFYYNSFSQTTVNLNPIKDNSIYSDNTSNSSGLGQLYSGKTCTNSNRRALIQFDLSTIPEGATITSVSLTLNINNLSPTASNDPYNLYNIREEWGEGTSNGGGVGAAAVAPDATWDDAMFGTSEWATRGGDYNVTSLSTQIFGLATGNETFNSTTEFVSAAQAWLDSPSTNYGLILIGNESTTCNARRIGSKDIGVPPVLTITYTPTLSIPDHLFNNEVEVYPNPNTGILNFDLNSATNVSIEVYNIQGRLTQSLSNINNRYFQFELLGNSGLYLVKIQTENSGTSFHKIIKE